MSGPGIGNSAPRGPGWVTEQIQLLWAALREAKSARSLNNATVDSGTGITFSTNGYMQVLDGNNQNVVFISAGSPAQAFGSSILVQRPDHTTMFGVYSGLTPPYQFTAICDKTGNPVLREDAVNGGIGRPYMSMGQWVDFAQPGGFPALSNTSTFTTQQVCYVWRSHAQVHLAAYVFSSSAGTTGECRLLDVYGQQVGSVLSIPANANTAVTLGPINWPSATFNWTFEDSGVLQLQTRRTAGTGSIGVRGTGIWGVGV